jgi:hypothetical protein
MTFNTSPWFPGLYELFVQELVEAGRRDASQKIKWMVSTNN